MKILLLDIETAPNLAAVFGLFNQNISIHNILESGYTLCWAAKWLGEDEIHFDSIYNSRPRTMIKRMHRLLSQADAVIHYNGTKFDIPTLNREFLMMDMAPPAPYKQIDLLRTVRNRFRFASNKLDYVARQLGIGAKVQHKGTELWLGCMNKDPESWEQMEEYNRMDVVLLEKLYERVLPWVRNHPNMSVFYRDEVCPHCASKDYQKRGLAHTTAGIYQRYKCKDPGAWFRGNKNIASKAKMLTSGV